MEDDKSDLLKDIAMATNLMAKNYLAPALIALSFQNGKGYCYLSVRVNSANDATNTDAQSCIIITYTRLWCCGMICDVTVRSSLHHQP